MVCIILTAVAFLIAARVNNLQKYQKDNADRFELHILFKLNYNNPFIFSCTLVVNHGLLDWINYKCTSILISCACGIR